MVNSVLLNRDNCSSLYFDDKGNITYKRIIRDKIITIVVENCDNIVEQLSVLSNLDDEAFMMLYELQNLEA